jgi:muconate cycloisomerase
LLQENRVTITKTSSDIVAGATAAIVIKRVDAMAVAMPLTKPMKMAHATFTKVENLIVRIEAEDGTVGWGEAASAPSLTGETWQGMVAIVRDYIAPLLVGKDARLRLKLVAAMGNAVYGATGSRSAVEMALVDLLARSLNVPVAMLLGGLVRDHVEPMWMLGNARAEDDVDEARTKAEEGFRYFKLKAGTKKLGDEIATVLTIRKAVGEDVKLCADSNSAFTLATARAYAAGTESANLAFIEQPFPQKDFAALRAFSRDGMLPVCADQSVHTISVIVEQSDNGAVGIALKLNKLGGFGACLRAAAICEERGLKIVSSAKVAESSLASAAIVHLSCVIPSVEWGVSLTHGYLAEDVVKTPLRVQQGQTALPPGPGLGVEVDERAVERLKIG